MKIIDRYLATHTIRGVLLVLSVFMVLFSFLEFLAQINDVGKGNFQMPDAFIYVVYTLPARAVDLMPLCILLGSIVALGLLADHNELVAMQAAGISIKRICGSVLVGGAVILLVTLFLTQFVAPPMEQSARIRRSKALYGQSIKMTNNGFWARNGRSFIHVGRVLSRVRAADIEIYELDPQGRLRSFIQARGATIRDGNQWQLEDVEQVILSEQGIETLKPENLTLSSFLSPEQMGILELPPGSLSLSDLYHLVQGLRKRGQNAQRYALALWQKLTLPAMITAMVMMSLAFIFGPTRSITAGRRIVMASMAGIAIYLIYQVIGHLALLLELPPPVATLTPVLVVIGVSVKLLGRST
jgi:lipopolysaccharide export system permease protein